ncbi:hypothetical protein ACQP2E_28080 [Actinoplanes sp. CA-015351]|uniref:hypothetical protein n=1 Tax=Actinoplanes sp. CA-015351 TaxID=3239897 RepID=UPI003D95B0AF
MFPDVRLFHDPYEGLESQLAELLGMARVVPPLIEADRQRRWDEIGSRPAGPDSDDMISVYEREAGPTEGYGHARYDHAIYAAVAITAWELFRDCVTRMLRESALKVNVAGHPLLAKIVDDEKKQWDRNFSKVETRLKEHTGVDVTKDASWRAVRHVQQLRNALVHNIGLYTAPYLRTPGAIRPSVEDLLGARVPADEDLVDNVVIPLSADLMAQIVDQMLAAARFVQDTLGNQSV